MMILIFLYSIFFCSYQSSIFEFHPLEVLGISFLYAIRKLKKKWGEPKLTYHVSKNILGERWHIFYQDQNFSKTMFCYYKIHFWKCTCNHALFIWGELACFYCIVLLNYKTNGKIAGNNCFWSSLLFATMVHREKGACFHSNVATFVSPNYSGLLFFFSWRSDQVRKVHIYIIMLFYRFIFFKKFMLLL